MGTDENPETAIEQLRDDFQAFLRLYRALNVPALRDRLTDELSTEERRAAYQLTEPDRSSRQISEALDQLGYEVSASAIRLWQQDWIRQGLVRKVSARKRERVFDLEEVGIDIGSDLSKINK